MPPRRCGAADPGVYRRRRPRRRGNGRNARRLHTAGVRRDDGGLPVEFLRQVVGDDRECGQRVEGLVDEALEADPCADRRMSRSACRWSW